MSCCAIWLPHQDFFFFSLTQYIVDAILLINLLTGGLIMNKPEYLCLSCYDGKGAGETILATVIVNINKNDEVVDEHDGIVWCGDCQEENIIPIGDKHLYPELDKVK
tara:strand:+ start:5059 stop:5379 length:321 start_codon:yes stop_codon:yes gene_type:complete